MSIDAEGIKCCLRFRHDYEDYKGDFPFQGTDKVDITQDGDSMIWYLWGCEIILNSNGTWYLNDTSGG